jgi:hypothetical protein
MGVVTAAAILPPLVGCGIIESFDCAGDSADDCPEDGSVGGNAKTVN